MAHLYDLDNQCGIEDRLEDAVVAVPDSVAFGPGEFLRTGWARVACELLDASKDSNHVRPVNAAKVAADARADLNLISCHQP